MTELILFLAVVGCTLACIILTSLNWWLSGQIQKYLRELRDELRERDDQSADSSTG